MAVAGVLTPVSAIKSRWKSAQPRPAWIFWSSAISPCWPSTILVASSRTRALDARLARILGHGHPALVVADHQLGEEAVGVDALRGAQLGDLIRRGHAGHAVDGHGHRHPRHAHAALVLLGLAEAVQELRHRPGLELLAEHDLAGDGPQHGVLGAGGLVEVLEAQLDGLVVVVAHVLQEPDVDGVGPRRASLRLVMA